MGHLRTRELSLFLCDKCNQVCEYCYPGDYKTARRSLDIDFAKAGILFFVCGNGDNRKFDKIRFYAVGEPTLEMELMKTIYEYAVSVAPCSLTFELQTNGTFSPSAAKWIASHIDIVWISLDGPPFIHDAQRPMEGGVPSSPIVLSNIKTLRQGDRCTVGVRPTITRNSIGYMREIVEFVAALEIPAVYFHPAIKPQGRMRRTIGNTIYDIPLLEFAQRYVEEALPSASEAGIFCGNFLTVNFDEPVKYFCRSCLPSPQLTVDGYVSCCDKAPYGSDPRFQDMIYGAYDKTTKSILLDNQRIEILRTRQPGNMKKCKQCSIAENCGGGCLGEVNFLKGDIFETIDEWCEALHYLAKNQPRNTGALFPFHHP